jgi:hypothetical protein
MLVLLLINVQRWANQLNDSQCNLHVRQNLWLTHSSASNPNQQLFHWIRSRQREELILREAI